MLKQIRQLFLNDSSTGVLLIIATALALIFSNIDFLSNIYNELINIRVQFRISELNIDKPLLLWINDGLMAIFFFLIGLEIKREILDGEFREIKKVVLPVACAIGGVVAPAIIYFLLNQDNPVAMRGWAIAIATDIAFAIGVLSLLGSKVPKSLKIFLLTLAIVDDLIAIVIIAIFYSEQLSIGMLIFSLVILGILLIVNLLNVESVTIYMVLGILLWITVLKSGVHATMAGVVLAFFIPMKRKDGTSPLKELEVDFHTAVYFITLPLFAFVNAGINLDNISFSNLQDNITLGIIFGLFFGKQIGVFLPFWILVKFKLVPVENNISWVEVYAVAILCGIGFTMSLFISSLAFANVHDLAVDNRLGILIGSAISAIIGYSILKIKYTVGQK